MEVVYPEKHVSMPTADFATLLVTAVVSIYAVVSQFVDGELAGGPQRPRASRCSRRRQAARRPTSCSPCCSRRCRTL
jgi:hypothetical protein